MDTISRENNSMLPIGGIVVGVIALLLGAYALVSVSKVKAQLAAQEEKVTAAESKVDSAAAAEKQDISAVRKETSDAFGNVANYINELRGSVSKLEDAQKKPVHDAAHDAAHKPGATSTEPAVAGPGEYIVKPGDSSGMKIATSLGVSLHDLMDVNPGVNWTKLKIGDKLKVPQKK
jgi:LysM repeat protein